MIELLHFVRKKQFEQIQRNIFDFVIKKYSHYYLVGGTALFFRYKHRESDDLDFFTQEYNHSQVDTIVSDIKNEFGFDYNLIYEDDREKYSSLKIFTIKLDKVSNLKIDFVEDNIPLIKEVEKGIASTDDIYIRKLTAVCGTGAKMDRLGREVSEGGRQTTRDLYDIYYLSKTKNNYKLSEFVRRNFMFIIKIIRNPVMRLNDWCKKLDRTFLMEDLFNIKAADGSTVYPKDIFKHIDNEIEQELMSEYKDMLEKIVSNI